MFLINQIEDWYSWAHIFIMLEHLFAFKLLFFIFAALIYPLIYLRNRYVNAESTKWSNVMLFTEKIGTLLAKTIFVLFIFFAIFLIARSLLI